MKKVSALANSFIKKAEQENGDISLLKLLKLCYFAQGFSLAILNRPIFDDDVIEAWRYGPVIPSLYHELKHFKSESLIRRRVTDTYLDDDLNFVDDTIYLKEGSEDLKIVDIVWNLYGQYSAVDLVDMTHRKGTPWDLVYLPGLNKIIPNNLIKEYYDILVAKM
ncbi:Panacea domain-containing protein [Ornithobacterium rhinotracheale]